MANSKNCSGNEPKTPVCLFIEALDKEITTNLERRATSRIKRESSETLRGYALCTLASTEQTHLYFRDMSNFELLDMQDSAKTIATYIDTTVGKDTELAKNIADASKLLKELDSKLHEANNAACTMRNCLISHLDLKDSDVPMETDLKCVIDAAKSLSEDGKVAAEAMVNAAGIHTFSNVESLTSHAQSLTRNIDDLKGWTDELVGTAMTDLTSAQEELDKVHLALNQQEFGYFHSTNSLNAANSTRSFICDENTCPPITCVDDICREMGEKNQGGDSSSADDFSQGDTD